MPGVECWMLPWLTGRCYDFALALAEIVPDAEFVAIGDARSSDHVGLRVGDRYLDVRGILDEAAFLAHYADQPVIAIGRGDVEAQCGLAGVAPPYRGVREIAEARRAVRRAFPRGVPHEAVSPEPPAPPRP